MHVDTYIQKIINYGFPLNIHKYIINSLMVNEFNVVLKFLFSLSKCYDL